MVSPLGDSMAAVLVASALGGYLVIVSRVRTSLQCARV